MWVVRTPFTCSTLRSASSAACRTVLGDTASGLNGGEIERLMQVHSFADPGPITNWPRLNQALLAQ